jgi:hypothetical protein
MARTGDVSPVHVVEAANRRDVSIYLQMSV